MDTLSRRLTGDLKTSSIIKNDVTAFLTHHDKPATAGHSARVAFESRRLADAYGIDVEAAYTAGLLHDISAVIPNNERIAYAEAWAIPVLPEERTAPMIVHQKLSAYMAREIFGVDDLGVLSAIGCHTTLKANATLLDKVVFVADKIEWDGMGDPPYLTAVKNALTKSIDHAVFCYIDYLWQRRDSLLVVHPWLAEAYKQLATSLGAEK